MKKWITALTFALALLVLSACSAQPGKTAAETEAKKSRYGEAACWFLQLEQELRVLCRH